MKATERANEAAQLGAARGAKDEKQQGSKGRRAGMIVWSVGVILFAFSCIGIHMHPQPFTFDLAIMQALQSWHLGSALDALVRVPSVLDNPFWSIVMLSGWLLLLLLGAVWAWFARTKWLLWLQNALFLIVIIASASGVNTLLDILVARPRPLAKQYPIQNLEPIVPFPSYPSGHAAHDVIYYGFLLYLSQIPEVRQWRYYRCLLPLQIFAVLEILLIGYSRILMGGHWPTDVLGGYVEGILYLCFCLFLYRLVTPVREKWQHHLDQKRRA